MLKRIILLVILLLYVFTQLSFGLEKNTRINRKFFREVNIINNNVEYLYKIKLKIKAKNFYSPFVWNMRIISNGKIVYTYFANDKDIDKLFNEGWYGNKNYIESKKQWYFHDLINQVEIYIPVKNLRKDNIIEKEQKRIIKNYLNKYKFDYEKTDKISNDMVNLFNSGEAICIRIRVSKEELSPEMIFCNELNEFIPIWEEY